jgi:hypothetical protein
MPAWMNDPWVQAAALPAAIALALTLIIRIFGGSGRGALLASAAVGIAFLGAYSITVGVPPLPPVNGIQKLGYLAAAGLVLGLFLDLFKAPRPTFWVVMALWPALVVVWLAEPRLAGMSVLWLIATAVLWFGGFMTFARLEGARDDGINAPVMLAVAAIGVAGLALIGNAPDLSRLGLMLAAAIGGFLICNWPIPRYPFGNALLFGASTTLLALAAQTALYTGVAPVSLIILLPVFFTDGPMSRAGLGNGFIARALAPLFLATAALVPVLVALGVAMLTSGTPV